MGSFPQSIVHYLPVTDHDERWGIVCTTAGYQNVPPGSPYPLTQHPDSYSFTRSRGRVLGEYQLLYIVSGQGEFRSASSPAAPAKAGTVVMLFPDEWHTYAPDPETGWEEWWVGFRGENIDRRVAEGFFSPKTPLLHIGHSAGIVSCYQEIIRSAEEERKGFQQLVTGIVLHLLGSVLFKRDNLQYLDNPIVEKINRAREMMRRHIGDNLPPEEIARRLNIGYTWFRRGHRPGAIPVATAPQQGPGAAHHDRPHRFGDRRRAGIRERQPVFGLLPAARKDHRHAVPQQIRILTAAGDRFSASASQHLPSKRGTEDREAKMRGNSPRTSQNDHERLRRCGAKDCAASTAAARKSPRTASALAC